MERVVYSFPRAGTMGGCPRDGGFNNRNLLPHSSGGWKSKIKVSAALFLFEGSEGRIHPRPLSWLLVVPWLVAVVTPVLTWCSSCLCVSSPKLPVL